MRPDDVIDACRTGHRRVVTGLVSLSEDDFLSPSLLPGYSRAHVVAHLINKSNAHALLLEGVAEGEVRQLHPDGYDADRAADAGALRSPSELRSDLEVSFERLETMWASLDDGRWESIGVMTAGPRTMAEIVAHHLRNVEVHHVDLDIGYRPADWPTLFVDTELAKRLRALPDRAGHADILAWLLGRAPAPDLEPW